VSLASTATVIHGVITVFYQFIHSFSA
jgi:hypothetical protein